MGRPITHLQGGTATMAQGQCPHGITVTNLRTVIKSYIEGFQNSVDKPPMKADPCWHFSGGCCHSGAVEMSAVCPHFHITSTDGSWQLSEVGAVPCSLPRPCRIMWQTPPHTEVLMKIPSDMTGLFSAFPSVLGAGLIGTGIAVTFFYEDELPSEARGYDQRTYNIIRSLI